MRAVALVAPSVTEVVDVDDPEVSPDSVLVEMRAVGICGSDVGVFSGSRSVPSLPWVLGHEGGGTVVATGSDVDEGRVGGQVVIEPNWPCLQCAQCRLGRTSLCADRQILGMTSPGVIAERVVVPSRFAWSVPGSWTPEMLACLEPFAVAVAAVRRSGVEPGENALVIGAGSLGIQTCLALVGHGVTPVVADPDGARVALAGRIGAEQATGDASFPFVFETAGVPAALRSAMSAASPGGTVTLMGLASGPTELMTTEIVRGGLTLMGSIIYDHPTDFDAAVAAMDGELVGEIIDAGTPPRNADDALGATSRTPAKSWIDLGTW